MTAAITPRRVLVIGTSCQIGHFLLPSLIDNGIEMDALSRQPHTDAPGLRWLAGALPEHPPPPSTPGAAPWDGIISYGPVAALADWLRRCSTAPAAALVAVSSMSVISKAASPVASERAMAARMRDSEQAIIQQCERLAMRWCILRPTLIYGAGLDANFTPLVRRAQRWRWFPLPRGHGLRQPVHAADVAEASWRALCRPEASGHRLQFGGGERLPVSEMFARVRASLDINTLPLPLWRWNRRMLALAVPRARGPLLRLDSDLVADNTQATALLGITPRPFIPDAQMWHAPDSPVPR